MKLREKDVSTVLEKAAEIAETYRMYVLAGNAHKKSVDDLLWLFGEHLGKVIVARELNLQAADLVVRGMYVALDDGTYEIYTLAELGSHEERFVLTKELFHVVMDDEDCRNMDIHGHLVEAQSSFSIGDSEPNTSVACELLAEIGAMEFLFPYADRVTVRERAGDNPDFAEIARRYGIPQLYIETYLSEHMMGEFARLQQAR